MKKPLHLTIHPVLPNLERAWLNHGGPNPAPGIHEAKAKRFNDAELAAEYWQQALEVEGCDWSVVYQNWDMPVYRVEILHRFATAPSYDQGDQ